MNSVRTFLLAASVAVLAGAPVAAVQAADTVQIDSVSTLDRLGDGTMTLTFHLSASQWTVWKQQYGDRPDVLWRNLKQQFASMVLDKFSLEKNDVERTATATLSVRGATRLRSDGGREVEVPKDMKLISNNGREWIFNAVSQESPYAPILTQTIRLIVPAEATNVRLNQPGTAFQALAYDMPPSPGPATGLLIAGIAAVVVGIGLGVVGFLPTRHPPPAPAAPAA